MLLDAAIIRPDPDGLTEAEPIAGYGRCRACTCTGYVPNDPKNNFCKTCEHNFDQHLS